MSSQEPSHATVSVASPSPKQTAKLAGKSTNHHDNRSFWQDDLHSSAFAECLLVILTFCTGIQDATTVPDYHCFTSNQTGNTVLLCLAIVLPHLNGDMFITSNVGTALGLFLGAGWLTGQLGHIVGPRRRWWLVLCNLTQTFLVFSAAAIQHYKSVESEGHRALLVVGMLAFSAGSQVVQSRSLAMTEISTAMATAAWVDLIIDDKLLAWKNRPRTRRIAFLLSLVAGCFVGAAIFRTAGSATAILVSGVGKLIVTVLYLFAAAGEARAELSMV